MSRFVLLSFVFLGWAFYEASGGSDFAPETPKRFAENAQRTVPAQAVSDATAAGARVVSTKNSEANIHPTVPIAVATPASAHAEPPQAAVQAVITPQPVQPPPARDGSLVSQPFANATGAALFSLTDTAPAPDSDRAEMTFSSLSDLADPAEDLRKVRASRINMRNGPGTRYSVLARLTRGEEVVVLQSPGSGWVKLRVVESGRIGWVAESLLETAS
ncbi:SH3 domain-containing protein [Shimia sp. SDUM112013]|uniref:SH3 domain-containing protein n=1 Tax=Shimia sp. SDUM112013 TaxID=3136160 RepID=UPI0032ECB875